METLLQKRDITSEELESLLAAREAGEVSFLLIDVREPFEYEAGHIKGVDELRPTSSFQQWAQEFLDAHKDDKVIFTCRTGNRSAQVAHIFAQNGMENAINHYGGIVTYGGEIET